MPGVLAKEAPFSTPFSTYSDEARYAGLIVRNKVITTEFLYNEAVVTQTKLSAAYPWHMEDLHEQYQKKG
jgi:hypothetical protein